MRDKISRFLGHGAVRKGYAGLLALFAALLAYHAVAIYAVDITCVVYNGPLYQSLLSAYYVAAIAASVSSVLGMIGWLILGRGKLALLFLALTLAVFLGGFRVFADAAFHCFGEALVEMFRSILSPLFQAIQPPQP